MHLKVFIFQGPQILPKPLTTNPIFACNSKLNSKLQELDNFCRRFSKHWDSIKVLKKKGQLSPKPWAAGDEHCSKSSIHDAGTSISNGLKEDNASKYSGRRQARFSYLAANALAEKMKSTEMMGFKEMDHALDMEEALYFYSHIACPAYAEIVDDFFMEMYSEFLMLQPSMSFNSSMRKVGSTSFRSSMRSLDPVKL